MNLTSSADRLYATIRSAHEAAVDDTLDVAREIAGGHSRTGKFAASLQRTATVETDDHLETRFGSPLRSARVKELGAWIAPKNGPYLVFNAGDGVRKVAGGVKIKAQPVVVPAGQRFRDLMLARLQRGGVS